MPDQWASTVDHAPSKDGWATTTEHSPEPTYPTVGGKERTPEQKAFYDSAVRGKGPVDTSADFDFDAIHQGVQSLKTPGQRLHGIHQIIAGLSQGVSMPAILGGLLTNPVGTATGLATGYAGSKTASTAAKMAHLSEGAQEVAGDVGGIVGGTAGYKAPSTLSAVLENPRAAQVLTGVGQVASAPVVAIAGHTLGHTVTGGVGAAGLAARGVKNIVGGATRELTPFELANRSLKVKLAPAEYLRPEDAQYPTRGMPMAEPAPPPDGGVPPGGESPPPSGGSPSVPVRKTVDQIISENHEFPTYQRQVREVAETGHAPADHPMFDTLRNDGLIDDSGRVIATVPSQPPPVNNQPLRNVSGEYRTPGLAPGETAEDYFARVVKPAAAGDYLRPEDAQYPIRGIPMQEPPPPPAPPPTPVVETPRPPSGEYVTPGLQPGQTAEDYFNQVIRPKSGGGFLEGDDAELLNGLSQHYEKVNFADLDPAAQVKVRALASKGVDASHPAVKPKSVDDILGRQPQATQPQAPAPAPVPVEPIAPGTTPAELLQQEMTARRGNPTRPNVAPPSEAVPGVNVPLRPPLAKPIAAEAPAPVASEPTPTVEPNRFKSKEEWHKIFADSERTTKKAPEIAQIGENLSWDPEVMRKVAARMDSDPSYKLPAEVVQNIQALRDVKHQNISSETLRQAADSLESRIAAKKKSISDMMK